MSESSKNDVLEKYKFDKYYKFITAIALSGILLILILILVYVAIPLTTQQVLIAIIGMVLLATLDAFKRCFEYPDLYQATTIIDNRQIENNTVYNTSYGKQNLAEAAAEIQELLEQLSQTYPTTTEKEQIELAVEAVDEIQHNPTLKSRLITALKAGAMEALKESINHPVANIIVNLLATEYSQEWQKSTTESVEDKTIEK
ncbi:hypothetical protein [Okeania sp. KiyG1]|uniref:hypothetical protein n=1 Tax=Okeania sp. KiyG1 TaxID=2720165 RepID=UPI00192153F3|nr:hypothetical protein [Okeania sp. KiyG1]GGA40482.1 hypothetical protein CYANOKiyG1_58750 [Okeania sp. KiyG1]